MDKPDTRNALPYVSGILVASDRSDGAVRAALDAALARARARHGRVWLVRTHVLEPEREAWQLALAGEQVVPIAVPGVAELTVLTP